MLSPVLLIFLITFANATVFTFINDCSQNITLYSITSYGTSFIDNGLVILPQQSQTAYTDENRNKWIGNFYANGSSASLAEFALDEWDGMDFYDISLILGFNLGIQISPSYKCAEVTCTGTPCSQAFLKPSDNFASHSCRTGTNYIITFCPDT